MPNDLLKSLFERAKNLILKPAETWDAIAAEETSVQDIYKRWVLPLAAIPAIAAFIGYTIVGTSALGFTYRVPFSAGLSYALVSYLLMLGAVYVYALILDALAPHFGAEKSAPRALKVAAYFPVAAWIAGVFWLVPPLAFLSLAGLYSLYLLFVGLPKLMPPAEGKTGGFVLAAIAVAVALYAVISIISSSLLGADAPGLARTTSLPATPLEQRMEDRSDALAAQGGDVDDVLSAVLGVGSGPVVESAALKDVAPSRIGGLDQRSLNVEQIDSPFKVLTLTAEYGEGDKSIALRIVNSPVLPGMLSAFGFDAASYNRRTDDGYERLRRAGDEWVIEEWSRSTQSGRYGATRGEAFMVEASGRGVPLGELERVVEAVTERDLARLPLQDNG